MSVSAVTEPADADRAHDSHALAFRIAFAAAVGLTLGEVLGWDFPFLPAMLAVQLLSGREPLSVKKGVAFVAVIVSACVFAVLVAQIFVDSPFVLLLGVSLVTFLAFLLLARGQAAGVAAAFLITTAVIPLLAIESMSVAQGFIYSLVAGSALAVVLTFAAQAFFPMHVRTRARFRSGGEKSKGDRCRTRQRGRADEPRDLFHADGFAGKHRRRLDGH